MAIVFVQHVGGQQLKVGNTRDGLAMKRITPRGPVWHWYDMIGSDAKKFEAIVNAILAELGTDTDPIDFICAVARATRLFPNEVIGWRSRPGSEPLLDEACEAIIRVLVYAGEAVGTGLLNNRCRRYPAGMMRQAVARLAREQKIKVLVDTHPINGKTITKVELCK